MPALFARLKGCVSCGKIKGTEVPAGFFTTETSIKLPGMAQPTDPPMAVRSMRVVTLIMSALQPLLPPITNNKTAVKIKERLYHLLRF